MSKQFNDEPAGAIAIVGMAGRFPGARNLAEFWRNLRDGVESVAPIPDAELLAEGVSRELLDNPRYVRSRAVLEDIELFDAAFFGFTPREAEIMDPQHRLFLECAWEALEDAGYDPQRYAGSVGVFASSLMSGYLLANLYPNRAVLESVGALAVRIANDRDFMPTRVSYKLNLRGPSFSVQTACSSSLIASHLACQSLIEFQCDMALAGGVSVAVPQKFGTLYQEGGIYSPDGHCRAFDAQARGTVSGSGMGIVVLKRLEDALDDGDTIHAVIRGSAVNNDGALKVGFTAPSVEGQAEVVALAQAVAQVAPETIGYIEAHGTGTTLGDPIEIAALTQVFRESTAKTQFCALGSVKTNIGHLDAAAGIAGLIKTVLALKHRQLPPSLHFTEPNPEIDFAGTPFYVNAQLRDWPAGPAPRRAGVSSFAVGGTNAHFILEEAPVPVPAGPARAWQLVTLSARGAAALDAAADRLASHFEQHPDADLADAAYTLQLGRRAFEHRRIVVAQSPLDAAAALREGRPRRVFSAAQSGPRPVAFLFPGQGAQYADMGRELYENEPVFRRQVDHCAEVLRLHLRFDLREALFPPPQHLAAAERQLGQTAITQPALFVVEYALARLWQSWGVEPQALLGHSIGEYVAACLAGVFSLEEALALVAARGRLMGGLPAGGMLSVSRPAAEIEPLLPADLTIAAINSPRLCVVAGPVAAVEAFEAHLTGAGIQCRRLHTSHAFHSPMVEPILQPFAERLARIKLSEPAIPFISNVTGTWITAAQATDPHYWAAQLRRPVLFSQGLAELLRNPDAGKGAPGRILLEVGPGRTLGSLARQALDDQPAIGDQPPTTNAASANGAATPDAGASVAGSERAKPHAPPALVLQSLRHPQEQQADQATLLTALGRLWLAGAAVDWEGFHQGAPRRRVPLPTYPFERKRFWIEPPRAARGSAESTSRVYARIWQEALPSQPAPAMAAAARPWLLFETGDGLGAKLREGLAARGLPVLGVRRGPDWARDDAGYTFDPADATGYAALVEAAGAAPRVVYLWGAAEGAEGRDALRSLLLLGRALGTRAGEDGALLTVITQGGQDVLGTEALRPDQALLGAVAQALPMVYPGLRCRTLDIAGSRAADLAGRLIPALLAPEAESGAQRGPRRWSRRVAPLPRAGDGLRQGGVYLLLDGLCDAGLAFARLLSGEMQARIALLAEPAFPRRADWPAHTAADDRLGRIIRQVYELEDSGTSVLVLHSDGGATAPRDACIAAERHFGGLHGVVYGLRYQDDLPGLAGDPAGCIAQLDAETHALQQLGAAAACSQLDTVLLLAPLRQPGDPAALVSAGISALMDLAARTYGDAPNASWISVAWDRRLLGAPDAGAALRTVLAQAPGAALLAAVEHPDAIAARAAQPAIASAAPAAHDRPQVAQTYLAPRNEIERRLAAIWQDLLGIATVGVHDDFFELGGHSLLATRLITRVQEVFDAELTLRDFFAEPSIAGVAARLPRVGHEHGPALVAQPHDGPLPLSFAQQRMWALDQLEPGSPRHNLPFASRFRGALDLAALGQSLAALIRRHAILRTSFVSAGGQPAQVIAPPAPEGDNGGIELPLIDLRAYPLAEREAMAQQLATQEVTRPFALDRAPLLRALVLHLADDEYLLVLVLHHIVFDGWSWSVLAHEIGAMYAAALRGRPAELPALPVQYADYVLWQRALMDAPTFGSQVAYWVERLSSAPPLLDLPADRPRPAVQRLEGARHLFELPAALADSLTTLGRHQGVTPFMLLLAAFKVLLLRYSDQDDIVIGAPVANREHPDLELLIGEFADMLALRTDLSGDPSFAELLGRVRTTVTGAYANHQVPFARVIEALRPERTLSYQPIFQVQFNLMNTPEQSLELPGLQLLPAPADRGAINFDLSLTLLPGRAGLRVVAEYSTALFERATIERLCGHFQALLERIVAQPEQRLSALLAAIPRPRQQLVVGATFTAEPIGESLAFWAEELGMPATLRFAPYGQVFQQLLDPAGLSARNVEGVNIVLLRLEDWGRNAPDGRLDEAAITRNVDEFIRALTAAAGRAPAGYLVGLCPITPGLVGEAVIRHQHERLRLHLEPVGGVSVLDLSGVPARYAVPEFYDRLADEAGHMPFTPAAYAALGTAVARALRSLRQPPFKVIAVDCDNTLWGGVCGEDGPLGVRLDPAHLALQQALVAQQQAGMLICLCSKNNLDDVLEVFRRRPEMPLRLDQIVAWRVNWQSKADNLRALAEELRLGLDSFVFIDDSPLECAEVRERCPEVLTVALPVPEAVPALLEHLWAFDHVRVTAEDRRRNELYAQNRLREQLRAEAPSIEAFLSSLQLAIDCAPLEPAGLARAADLTQRTNQFNLTGTRRDEGELARLMTDTRYVCRTVRVRDRFGDYGVVGVLIAAVTPAALVVDTWLLSCRVLGRRVEDALLLELARLAAERGCTELRVPFLAGARNVPALEFLRRVAPDAGQPITGGLQFSFAVDMLLSGGLPDHQPVADADVAVAPQVIAPPEPAEHQAGRLSARAALLERIAREFQTGAQILAALAARGRARARPGSQEVVAPRTPAEQTLAAIWSEVLRVDQVGIHDSFFGLGGDSILIVQAVSRARAAGLPLTPRHIFEHRTIAALAELIAHSPPPDVDGPAPADLPDEELTEADLDTILAQLSGEF